MIQYFVKNGVVRAFNVVGGKVMAMIRILGLWVGNPTLEQLYAEGWEDYVMPVPEPPSKEEQYWNRYMELKREKYDMDKEFELLRQRSTKALEFAAYYDDCDDFKKQAYREVYGTTPPLNL